LLPDGPQVDLRQAVRIAPADDCCMSWLKRIAAVLQQADSRLRLKDVMRARGAYLPEPPAPAVAGDFEKAKQRCAECHQKELCDELLARGAKEGYGRFCPNAPYIEQLRSGSLKFD